MRTSTRRFAGCLTVVLLACIAVVALVLWGPDVSIPWAGTRITLPDNTGYFTYSQKGVHYSRVLIPAGSSVQERWLPYRPCYGSLNVYYYSTEGQRCIRLQDEFYESLIDLQSAKTFLLVRSPDGQLFRGEILDCEDGSKGSSINGSPWKVTVEDRIAENITDSDFATNRGLYLGRIEVSENKESQSDTPLIQFVTAKESPELVIKGSKPNPVPTAPPTRLRLRGAVGADVSGEYGD